MTSLLFGLSPELISRRMYEVMVAWETIVLTDPPPNIQDFAKN
jgi:hypothetical protein